MTAPRLTLFTLTRGDGLLGLMPFGPCGPRGVPVSVVRADWPGAAPEPVVESAALSRLRALGLHPVPEDALQWRKRAAGIGQADLWTLVLEDAFGDWLAEQVPELEAEGWQVVVQPGFAHAPTEVQAWRLALAAPAREGSWWLSLGIEVDGQTLDLAPLIADLIKRDGRWTDVRMVAQMDDAERIRLRAPGGRRIDVEAAPLKAIVGAMLDLLTGARPREGPLVLSPWDTHRLDALRRGLLDAHAACASAHGGWQLQGEAGLQALAERLRGSGGVQPVAAPNGLSVQLRPYQLHGVAWLQYLRAQQLSGILADDMGLGKTAQALAHLLIEKEAGRLDLPALVVVPSSIVFNWQAEASRMAPGLRVLTLTGPARAAERLQMPEHDLVLTSYALLWRDIRALEAQPFHLLVLDEAQTVKNAAGRTARAVRRLNARHRLSLTGTPLENHLGELWAQFDFLMPGFLGDARHFHRVWRKPIEENGETLRAELLARRVRPFILRRRKVDVATELLPRTEVVTRVRLSGRQRALYETVRVAADEQVRRELKRRGFKGAQISILGALLKLRQVCCDPRLLLGDAAPPAMESAKLDLLKGMLPALVAEGRRVLVFSQFTSMLALIGQALDALGLPWLSLTGRTPPSKRGAVVETFQARAVPILLVSTKAGGVGLNLTAADTVIHVDPWWNPAVTQQATARAHRIGQAAPVFVYQLVAEGSIEERMLELQARKTALAEGMMGSDGAAAAKFGAEDLEGLLAPLR